MAIEGYATFKAMFVPGLSPASLCFEWLNSSINLENYLLEWYIRLTESTELQANRSFERTPPAHHPFTAICSRMNSSELFNNMNVVFGE